MTQPKVSIVLGSDSDFPVIQNMLRILADFGIEHEVTIPAHRSPTDAALRLRTGGGECRS